MEDFGKNILLWAPLVIILIAVMYMRVRQDRIKDLYAPTEEKKKSVSKELRGFALPRKNKVLDDVTVVSYGHTGYADHMLIGPFGVLLVYDLCTPGAYYGAVQDQKWTISNTTKEQRIQVDNPFIAADACSGRVITLLKKNGLAQWKNA